MKACGALLVLLSCSLAETQLRSETISENDIGHQGVYTGAEIRENDISGEGERTEAAATTQQTCQPDIHTVLREMTALVTELKVELRYTKTQVEVLETRLRASENKAETMETRLRASEGTVEEQRVELRLTKKQVDALEAKVNTSEIKSEIIEARLRASEIKSEIIEARLRTSEIKAETLEARLRVSEKTVEDQSAVIKELKGKQEDQAATVTALGGSVSQTGSQVEELRREREERKVSFSASLLASGYGLTGPFSVATPLVYKHIFTNVGNAYNSNTGVFTAPVRGVYHFGMSFHGYGHSSTRVEAFLYKNSALVCVAKSHQPSHSINASNGASLLLEVGDVVYVKLHTNAWVYDNRNYPFSTFSGHLLFPM